MTRKREKRGAIQELKEYGRKKVEKAGGDRKEIILRQGEARGELGATDASREKKIGRGGEETLRSQWTIAE